MPNGIQIFCSRYRLIGTPVAFSSTSPSNQAPPLLYDHTCPGSIPLRRFEDPEDVANAVAFLASEDAAYITGEALNVTGGQTMH